MTYQELKEYFCHHESTSPIPHLSSYITFSSFGPTETRTFSNRSRTYVVSSDNKAYLPNMGGYSIFGIALDDSDNGGVRLDHYMQEERGGEDGWAVEDCCILAYLLTAVNERNSLAPQIFFSEEVAMGAMVDKLSERGELDSDLLWYIFQENQGHVESENFGVTKTAAWLNESDTGNWNWTIQLLRIYSPTHIEVGDVMDG